MSLINDLLKEGKIDKNQASEMAIEAKSFGKKEEEVILSRKIVEEEYLFELKSKALKIPLKTIYAEDVSLKVLELISEDSAKHYKMIPLGMIGEILDVGMVYPEDITAKEALKFLSRQAGFSYEIHLITLSSFNALLRKYRNLKKEVTEALGELEVEKPKKEVRSDEIKRMAERAPISKIVSVMISHAVEGGVSDIHIEPLREKLRVRYRSLGQLSSSLFLPKKVHPAVVARVKILSDMKIDETRIPQDGRFSIKMSGRNIDFRVSTFPTSQGEKVAIRILDPEKGFKEFGELGLEGRNLDVMKDSIKKPYGMILATGPTGSGKSTTLYSILKSLNSEDVNIITLEDPIEYNLDGVNQSQVKPDIGYTFATGLRHIMRQDPDIIMVGEIRDEETAALAIHSALTGHLVLSTLHTNNATGVIPRLVDMGVEPFLLPATLNIAMAQRLARALCPECKKKEEASPEAKALIEKEIMSMPSSIREKTKVPSPLYIYKPQGCKKCNHTGFSSRIGIFEVLSMTQDLSQLILKDLSEPAIIKEAEKQGMTNMRQDGILKVLAGLTTLEEIIRVTK
jgi:type IV pilus assembly protein PilB